MAELLEIDWPQLYYITSLGQDRYRYETFTIPKKHGRGQRTIQSPHPTVKILQRKLLSVLYLVYSPHPAAHGFVPGHSIKTNATAHQRKLFVLNVDIRGFFPAITFPRVRGVFIKRFRIPPDAATILARICCNTGDEPDHLPQGGPTSPIVSNMICHALDHQLVTLASRNGLYYTRYADDLTFSTNRRTFPALVAQVVDGHLIRVGDELNRIVESNGFSLNTEKERLFSSAHRQEVTGLTVNKRVNLPRSFVNEIRGMLHAWSKWGHGDAQAEYHERFDTTGKGAEFRSVLAGKLAFLRDVRGVDDRVFRRLYGWARDLDEGLFPELPELTDRASSLREAVGSFPSISRSDSTETRRMYLKRMFASARGTLWLVDPDLRIEAIRDLAKVVEPQQVSCVQLLSKPGQKGGDIAEYVETVRHMATVGVRLE